ncbi:MAG TPA: glycogen debranching protein GlgX [Spirochaetota bacterium]|nr:glycogen debranching protein GlgX [Spirochaetota bacterium]
MKPGRITLPGYPSPLGVKLDMNGAQFAVFSRHATSVTLVLFESADPDAPVEEFVLDPHLNKTGDIWHLWIAGVSEGQLYGYRMDGPYLPFRGHRFNPHKLLLDPYARSIAGGPVWDLRHSRGFDPDSPEADLSFSKADNAACAPRCIVVNTEVDLFDRPLKTPLADTIIYELHVRGFSVHPSSGVEFAGTYRGIIEKIPYLKELGVTAVELMPVQEFDELENINVDPATGERLRNYWGYSTMSFFAPRGRYSHAGCMGEQVYEFKDMMCALHEAGLEVILDVVFNHTAEGDQMGPTLSFRGIDNSIYYILDENRRLYKNFSGCGNTINCNHPLVRDFIIDCLKFWVVEMHVDGFRFDLASILGRDQTGAILANPPLIEKIMEDPILRSTKIIAEAWDAAGAYQVGNFPGRWAEWNGKFRDDVRRFWRGDENTVGYFATRITGSSDLYGGENKGPLHSINFITCHDGFTMNDLVSFRDKHNEANGEGNRDGENSNLSANYGIEGAEVTPFIERRRVRQIKNFIATLFLAQGVPMLLAGDEFRRTQRGNNNAYCQDNDISWIDWGCLERHREIVRFCREMIRFRKEHHALRKNEFFTGSAHNDHPEPDISWHGTRPGEPDWLPGSRFIACLLNGAYVEDEYGTPDVDIYMVFNASLFSYPVLLPPPPSGGAWRVAVDTALPEPDDIAPSGCERPLDGLRYRVQRGSTVVLISGA